jgi:hypothetical protein
LQQELFSSRQFDLLGVSRLRLHVPLILDGHLPKAPRLFHAMKQFHTAIPRVPRHSHLQFQLVVIVQLRADRNQVYPRRHNLFHVFKHASPGERLSLDQGVQILRFTPHRAILREVERLLSLRFQSLAVGD